MLGGTFDPIHHGHLRCAWELKEQLGLDELRLIPCHRPVHRAQPDTESVHRLAMVRLAVQGITGLSVDDREIVRDTPSYSIDTLRSLKAELGQDVGLIMALGTDSFASLSTWHEWESLLDYCHIVIMMRPGSGLPLEQDSKEGALLARHQVKSLSELRQGSKGGILPWKVTALDISATAIRSEANQGISPRFLLPDVIWDYIKENKLYNS
jgi:nicotinate-nucleotide adenylyltransferase